jgi:hypothetical protein
MSIKFQEKKQDILSPSVDMDLLPNNDFWEQRGFFFVSQQAPMVELIEWGAYAMETSFLWKL